MTGRHAGTAIPADQAMLDQVRACHTEICEFMAAEVARPLVYDQGAAYSNAMGSLMAAIQIMGRAAAAFTFVEAQAGL